MKHVLRTLCMLGEKNISFFYLLFASSVFIYSELMVMNDLTMLIVMINSIVVFQLQLQRNEVIALTNLLNRLSESVYFVHKMAPNIDKLMEEESSFPASGTPFL